MVLFTRREEMKKAIDLFCGTKSFGNIAKEF